MGRKSRKRAGGITLVEMLIAVLLFGLATGGIIACFVAALGMFRSSTGRHGIQQDASRAAAAVTSDIRRASSVSVPAGGFQLDFVTDRYTGSDASYSYMLYNSTDPLPNPPFSASTYQLIRVPMASGTPQLGSAVVIARNVAQPGTATPVFSLAPTPTPVPSPTAQPTAYPQLVTVNFTFTEGVESFPVRTGAVKRR